LIIAHRFSIKENLAGANPLALVALVALIYVLYCVLYVKITSLLTQDHGMQDKLSDAEIKTRQVIAHSAGIKNHLLL
jgi:hypothetical protein